MAEKRALSAEIQGQWARIRGRLRDEFGDAVYRSWLKPLTLMELEGGRVRLAVPLGFLRNWIASNYLDNIRALWIGENADVNVVEIVVDARATEPPAETEPTVER